MILQLAESRSAVPRFFNLKKKTQQKSPGATALDKLIHRSNLQYQGSGIPMFLSCTILIGVLNCMSRLVQRLVSTSGTYTASQLNLLVSSDLTSALSFVRIGVGDF